MSKNFALSKRTAQDYMLLAQWLEEMPESEHRGAQSVRGITRRTTAHDYMTLVRWIETEPEIVHRSEQQSQSAASERGDWKAARVRE